MSRDPEITDNGDARRYELTVDGQTAVVLYNEADGGLLITETIVPIPLEGRGLAAPLARHILADIRERGLLAPPTWPFFAGYLRKHSEE